MAQDSELVRFKLSSLFLLLFLMLIFLYSLVGFYRTITEPSDQISKTKDKFTNHIGWKVVLYLYIPTFVNLV